MLIEIEGIDGAGKTTQCRLLKNRFNDRGERAIVVKDLESTQLGRQIKAILVTNAPRTVEVELYAFLCCKAQLFSEVIKRELEQGTHVICDRGIGSFLSYFEVLGFKRDFLTQTLTVAVPGLSPSMTMLIDLEVQEAMRRNIAKPFHSKFDGMGGSFFEKQRRIFKDLAQTHDWTVIRGTDPIETVHRSVSAVIETAHGK